MIQICVEICNGLILIPHKQKIITFEIKNNNLFPVLTRLI